jgi:hypothetical protein
MQSSGRAIERRGGRREAAAFSLRFHRDGAVWNGGWVVDLSPTGAAFLTMDENVPQVGDELELGDLPRWASGAGADAGEKPRRARVTRIDDLPGLTRKIAVEFENAEESSAI